MKNRVRIFRTTDFSKKIDFETKILLVKILNTANVLKPTSITYFIQNFLLETEKFTNSIIRFNTRESATYFLIITSSEIRLAKDYQEVIMRWSRNNDEIILEERTGEGLRAIIILFREILEWKEAEKL